MRWFIAAAITLTPSIVAAHVTLVSPPPRTASQKVAVCGAAGSVRGANVTTFAPGATITVSWKETIDHPGHYRIAFDEDGQDFPIPPSSTPGATDGMPTVVVDPIADIQGNLPLGGRSYTQEITLPNIECETCTLQLIQMMTDKLPYTTDGNSNDIYYQCADIRLSNGAPPTPDAGVPGGDDAGTGGGGDTAGGCSAGGGAGVAGLIALLGLRRRKRS